MASVGATKGTVRLQCSAHRESGACGNGRKVSRDMVEATVFAGLAEELIHPAAIAEYVKTYNAERRRLAKGNGERMAKLSRREVEIGRELERAIDTVTQGADIRARCRASTLCRPSATRSRRSSPKPLVRPTW